MVRSRRRGVEGEVELVVPAELKTSLGQAVIPLLVVGGYILKGQPHMQLREKMSLGA